MIAYNFNRIRKKKNFDIIDKQEFDRRVDMEIREYKSSDCNEIADLFYNTVHCINAKDYTEDQLNVWATGNIDIDEWNESLLNNYRLIAE